MSFHVPEKYRVRVGEDQIPNRYLKATGNNGAFEIPMKERVSQKVGGVVLVGQGKRWRLWCIASDATGWEEHGYALPGWEHVSVSVRGEGRCPTWQEMCAVKNLFWDEEDAVIEIHPPKSEYVNYREFVLHLWRPIGVDLPRPPAEMVGPIA